jgi:PhnB protein
MSRPDAHLTFDGDCAEAMRFYERLLGGKLEMLMTYGQSPYAGQTPEAERDRVLHARLALPAGGLIMGCDTTSQHPYEGMRGFSLSLIYRTVAEARPVFEALADGGKVGMPFAETFWAEAFGMVTDRFGTPWMVNAGMQTQAA